MKRLLLIRHAKSSWSDAAASDFDRGLNTRGKRDGPFMAEKLAQRLKGKALVVDSIVASPAKRARKTALFMARAIGYDTEAIRYDNAAYCFTAGGIIKVLQRVDDSYDTVLFVGHNHGITELAEWLCGEPLANIPTSGIVAIDCSIERWNELEAPCGTMSFFDYPKKFSRK
jgi:phosphohistidine phosphatase